MGLQSLNLLAVHIDSNFSTLNSSATEILLETETNTAFWNSHYLKPWKISIDKK